MFKGLGTDWLAIVIITAVCFYLLWLDRKRKVARQQEYERNVHQRMVDYKLEPVDGAMRFYDADGNLVAQTHSSETPDVDLTLPTDDWYTILSQQEYMNGGSVFNRILASRLAHQRRGNAVQDAKDYQTLWRNEEREDGY
jgi:hypothetical protein